MKDWKFLLEKYALRQHREKHEPNVVKAMRKMRGNLFIDIGSNRKLYANLLKKNFKHVLTIDPNPKWNADLHIAISNRSGSRGFYIGDDEGGADSLISNPHINRRDYSNQTKYNVSVLTFDELGLDADLVKIDVEGAEFEVLEGMMNRLPRAIMLELHDERRENELIRTMILKGYKACERIDGTHWLFGKSPN